MSEPRLITLHMPSWYRGRVRLNPKDGDLSWNENSGKNAWRSLHGLNSEWDDDVVGAIAVAAFKAGRKKTKR